MSEATPAHTPIAPGRGGYGPSIQGVRVLGMHRSGTSFVAGCLARGGYFVGDEQRLLEPNEYNPYGYFERNDVVALNDRMLSAFGGSWWNPPDPEQVTAKGWQWVAAASEAVEVIHLEAGDRPCVLKDPRMATLLPVWDKAIGPRFLDVLVIRNPIDVAHSLMRRNAFTVEFSLALWELHLVSILRAARGRRMVTVNFNEIGTHDSGATLPADALAAFGQVGLPVPQADGFVAEARHFASSDEDLLSLCTPSQVRLWAFLSALAPYEDHLVVPEEFAGTPVAATGLVRAAARLVAVEAGDLAASRGTGNAMISGLRNHLTDESDDVGVLVRQLAEAHRANAVLEGRLGEVEERVAMLSSRLAQRAVDLARLEQTSASLQTALAAAVDESREQEEAGVARESSLRVELDRSNEAVTSLRARVRAAKEEIAALQSQLAATVADGAVRRAAAQADFDLRTRAFEAIIAESDERVRQEQHAAEVARGTARGATATAEAAERKLAEVLASRSWRMTRPLRAAMYVLRGRRPR